MKTFKSLLRRTLLVVAMMLTALPSFAQLQVSGLVLDQYREPVIGASVIVKGTSQGTATDLDGRFTLSVPSKDAMLLISYVGCISVEIKADSPELASGIVLKENAEVLDEVV